MPTACCWFTASRCRNDFQVPIRNGRLQAAKWRITGPTGRRRYAEAPSLDLRHSHFTIANTLT
eukprot:4109529-Amphidinium_carterae.1